MPVCVGTYGIITAGKNQRKNKNKCFRRFFLGENKDKKKINANDEKGKEREKIPPNQ